MKISKRINKIIEYIDVTDKVADIGCDHGYLGLGCLEKGVSFVQNIDNKNGPLNTAKKNLAKFGNEKVIYTLCDGLDNLHQEVDTIVISGMGGDLITQIIMANLFKAQKLKKIIIVAHSKVPFLREKLTKYFSIVYEDLVEDNDKIYEIIVFDPQNKKDYSEEDYLLGPILKKEKSVLFLKKLNKRLKELETIIERANNTLVPQIMKELIIIKRYLRN